MTNEKGPRTDVLFSAAGFRFALIVSGYNADISDRLLEGARKALSSRDVKEADVQVFRVPGSFELPQAARKVAETRQFDVVICVGAVIRGETLHFELISQECARGIQQASVHTGIPMSFGVITANTQEQALARSAEDQANKGWEAAMAAIEMANLYKKIDQLKHKIL
jgi:6,7-dimethyl-8-ribityllumazine synthase